jgi:hypothetical protein
MLFYRLLHMIHNSDKYINSVMRNSLHLSNLVLLALIPLKQMRKLVVWALI